MTAFLVGAVVLAVLGVALQQLLADELVGWVPVLSHALVRLAARRLDDAERDRWREEWTAEVTAYGDRRLSGLAYAMYLLLSTLTPRAHLQDKFDTGTLLPGFTDGVPRSRKRLTGTAVWEQVIRAMHDPDLALVDSGIARASERFALALAPATSASLLLYEQALKASVAARDHAVATEPPAARHKPFWAPSYPAPKPWLSRRAAGVNGDPEWRIAPLSATQRRLAQPYIDALQDDLPGICPEWHPSARRNFLNAIERYDDRKSRRQDRGSASARAGVSLEVFLAAWVAEPGKRSAVRRIF